MTVLAFNTLLRRLTNTRPSSSPDADLTDEQLVARVLAGRRDAFNTLIVRHERRLYRFLCRAAACEADVEDAMQQAAVKAYTKLRSFDPRYRFTTWLFTIALRELRSLGRGGGRRGTPMRLDDAPEPPAPPDEQAPPDGPGELWQTARRVLSDTQYTALWLRYGEDLAAREIAKVMGRPRVWVSVTLHRACATVRKFADNSSDESRTTSSPKRQADRINQSERTAGGVS